MKLSQFRLGNISGSEVRIGSNTMLHLMLPGSVMRQIVSNRHCLPTTLPFKGTHPDLIRRMPVGLIFHRAL